MYVAEVTGSRKTPSFSGERGVCPGCGNKVSAKCGTINAWHFAHIHGGDCDSWHSSSNEGAWHLGWKNYISGGDINRMEVTVRDLASGKWHRADVIGPTGVVIEIQHSPLSAGDVLAREAFYQKHTAGLVWLFDFTSLEESYIRWDPRVQAARCFKILDLGDTLAAVSPDSREVFFRAPREEFEFSVAFLKEKWDAILMDRRLAREREMALLQKQEEQEYALAVLAHEQRLAAKVAYAAGTLEPQRMLASLDLKSGADFLDRYMRSNSVSLADAMDILQTAQRWGVKLKAVGFPRISARPAAMMSLPIGYHKGLCRIMGVTDAQYAKFTAFQAEVAEVDSLLQDL